MIIVLTFLNHCRSNSNLAGNFLLKYKFKVEHRYFLYF